MRVALLSHNAHAGDAIGNQVAEKLAFFLERGADARVFVESDRNLHPGVRGHCRTFPGGRPDADAWRFLADCDLVTAEYGQYYALLDLLPALAGARPRVLLDYHGVTPPELWGLQNREALDRGVRQRGLVWCADAVLAHSTYTLRELRKRCDFPADRLHRVGFPIDTARFCPGPGDAWRQALGLGDASVVLFVGRLAPNKRVPVLIEAVARLRDARPPVHILVAGEAGDVYRAEAARCRRLAADLGIADRLHLLGRLTGESLADAYRAADALVVPSLWESFCIPAVEAMACGVPVVAACTTALPETVADAGLTFAPDDPDDLARQLRRVLPTKSDIRHPTSEGSPARVAIVSFRYGDDFVGGAEASLRTIARTLVAAGGAVEVFATCTRGESVWADELPEGTTSLDGIPVHRFRLDAHDRARHLESVRAILEADGRVAEAAEQEYLRHSVHSARLLEALRRRGDDFDAIITGPYLYGLTFDVAAAFPGRTLLLPCFHDEAFARLRVWPGAYGRVGGVLYHSPEEQHFAQADLGLNHPGATCIGTRIDTVTAGDAVRGRRAVGGTGPYVVYSGRYSLSKDFPALLEHARRYHARRPGRFTFVFMGEGAVAVPAEPWARDLGFVDDAVKRDVTAGAAALVQLSPRESLSLAALEAWAQGTPVLASRRCAVLAGHLGRCGGGRAVEGYEEFEEALDDLWDNPQAWQEMGRRGRDYACAHYGSQTALAERLLRALADLRVPLAEQMCRRGLERAAAFSRPAWREQFARVVEEVLDAAPRPYREHVEVSPRGAERSAAAGAGAVLVPVRVVNRGTHPLAADGPARTMLRCRITDEEGRPAADESGATPLPGLLQPGRSLAAVIPVPVPAEPGTYRVTFWAERVLDAGVPAAEGVKTPPDGRPLRLVVEEQGGGDGCCAPALDAAQAALVEASRLRTLPDDYTDVTEGLFAALKRRVKRKLLGNFKNAYVDVLSRQQSAFNSRLLDAVGELVECCATLDHAVRLLLGRVAELESQGSGRSALALQPAGLGEEETDS